MLIPLKSCADQPVEIVGAKASHLARSLMAGMNVPPGWVIPSTQFRAHLQKINKNREITKALGSITSASPDFSKISSAIQSLFTTSCIPVKLAEDIAELPEGSYAVRSSASFEDSQSSSWAGQFDTFLEVPKIGLAEAVIRCWASCFSARALSYNSALYQHPDDICFAVIIQKMATSEYAGVAFSRHPTSGDKKTFIEMVKGSGSSLVSGKAADFFAEIDHHTQNIAIVPDKQTGVLAKERFFEIDRMVRALEQQKGWPVDVEFCVGADGLSLLQVRPMTVRSYGDHHSLPHLRDYELTFKVNGISLLFASILTKAFGGLDPLFTSDKDGQFRQYFMKEKMRWAGQFGFNFLSSEGAFANYATDFQKTFEKAQRELDAFFNASAHSPESILKFGDLLSSLFELYSRTDVQYTNEAFANRERNPTLRESLEKLAHFKDIARGWINSLFLPPDAPLNRFSRLMQEEYKCSAVSIENRTLDELAAGRCEREFSQTEMDPYIIWSIGSKRRLVTGSQAQIAITLMAADDDFDPNASALRGTVANGSVDVIVGTVRVIEIDYANIQITQASIDRMVNGEILIAEFTAPELLVACKKAKAIVTDIGGLLSHAAIVSRELNVPCLVGTKHASKLFKTGDSVRIDFKIGVISRLG